MEEQSKEDLKQVIVYQGQEIKKAKEMIWRTEVVAFLTGLLLGFLIGYRVG